MQKDEANYFGWSGTKMDPVHIVVLVILLIVAAVLSHYYWVILEKIGKISGKVVGGVLSRHYKKQKQTYPMVTNQLKRLRSLAHIDITSVEFTFDRGKNISLQNRRSIDAFKGFLTSAEISAVRNEAEQLKIQIHTRDDSFSYEAFVPTDNKVDIILKIPECGDYGGIGLTGLKRWLDESLLNKEK